MKRFKSSLTLIAVMFGVVAAFAFNSATVQDEWFAYDGFGDKASPASYSLVDGGSPSCSITDDVLCRVFVESDGGNPERPDETELGNLQAAIAEAEDEDAEVPGQILLTEQ